MGEISQLYVSVGAKIDKFLAGMGKVSKNVTGLQGKMSKLGSAMTKYVTLPLAAIGAASVYAFTNFEDALTKSLAIMGNVSDEMRKKMSDTAREVGKTTLYSAEQAAEAYYYLASAGLSAAQSLEALPKVAQFAQAGNFDLARATELLNDAQSQLGMKVEDATKNMEAMVRVSDTLVRATSMANATTEQFAEALTNKAGAALRLANKEIEEGVAVLAVYADQGIKGQEAGEKLYMAMRDLQKVWRENKGVLQSYGVEVFDASGTMRNMGDIIADLETAFQGMTDEQKMATLAQMGFQERSKIAIMTLLGFSDEIKNYEQTLKEAAGTTEDVSNKQLESFKSKLILLKDKFVDIGIGIGEKLVPAIEKMLPAFEKIGGAIAGVVSGFSSLPSSVQTGILAMLGIAVVIGPIMKVVGAVMAIGKAFTITSLIAMSSANCIAIAIAAAVAGAVAIGWAVNEWWQASKHMEETIKKNQDALTSSAEGIDDLKRGLQELGAVLPENTGLIADWQQMAYDAFADVVEAGKRMGRILEPVPDDIITAWKTGVPYFRDAAVLSMNEYIAGMLQRGGYAEEESYNIAENIVNGLGSQDETARQNALEMLNKFLMGLVVGGEITLIEANRIRRSIIEAMKLQSGEEGEATAGWNRIFNTITSGFQRAIEKAREFQRESRASVTPGGRGGTGDEPLWLQHGGIVTRPTLAMIGEVGPEAVIPLSKMGQVTRQVSQANTYNVYLPNVTKPEQFEAWANRKMHEAVMRKDTG